MPDPSWPAWLELLRSLFPSSGGEDAPLVLAWGIRAVAPALALAALAPPLAREYPGCASPGLLRWTALWCTLHAAGAALSAFLAGRAEPPWAAPALALLAVGLVLTALSMLVLGARVLLRTRRLRRARVLLAMGAVEPALRHYEAVGALAHAEVRKEIAEALHGGYLDPERVAAQDLMKRVAGLPSSLDGAWLSVARFDALCAAAAGFEEQGKIPDAGQALRSAARELPALEAFAREVGAAPATAAARGGDKARVAVSGKHLRPAEASAGANERPLARRATALLPGLADLAALTEEVRDLQARLRALLAGGGVLLKARRRMAGGEMTEAGRILETEAGDAVAAAACYARAGDLVGAGRCYESVGRRAESLVAYRLAGDRVGQARILEAAGRKEDAAELQLALGDSRRAAELYAAADLADRAIRVLETSGETEKAALLAEERGLFFEAARLSRLLGEEDRALALLVRGLRERKAPPTEEAGRDEAPWLDLLESILWTRLGPETARRPEEPMRTGTRAGAAPDAGAPAAARPAPGSPEPGTRTPDLPWDGLQAQEEPWN